MIHYIQLLRFVAAILVVALHSFTGSEERLFGFDPNGIDYYFEFGAVGVHVFFVISGFIMVYAQRKNFERARPLSFIARRLDRIYPLYWICVFLTMAAFWLSRDGLPNLTFFEWVGALLLLPCCSPSLIPVGWTLSYELFFYLAFACILALQISMFRSLVVLTLLFLGLVAIGRSFGFSGMNLAGVTTGVLLLEFVLGAWVGYLFKRLGYMRRLGFGLAGFALVLFVAGLIAGYNQIPLVISWGIPSGLLVLGAVLADPQEVKHSKLLHFFSMLGDASYALYLIHPATIAILLWVLPVGEIGLASFIAYLIVSLFVATVVSLIIDRWLQPRIKLS